MHVLRGLVQSGLLACVSAKQCPLNNNYHYHTEFWQNLFLVRVHLPIPCCFSASMPPKTTNAQYKNRLAYDSGTQPAFLRALQARISGKPDPTQWNRNDEDDDEGPGDADWEQLDSNRPAIPRRPDEPSGESRKGSNPNNVDEDDEFDDERPTVVVLKEGKHMTELEVTNEKRRRAYQNTFHWLVNYVLLLHWLIALLFAVAERRINTLGCVHGLHGQYRLL